MRKILLTESQVRLLTEEIDKNDSIQKLLFTNDFSKITFNDDEDGNGVHHFTPVVDGKKITDKFVKLTAEEVKVKNTILYAVDIEIGYEIRRLGIAERILTALILSGKPICSFYNKADSKLLKGLMGKLKQNKSLKVNTFKYNGEEVGFIASKK